jgi:hypothetical protein
MENFLNIVLKLTFRTPQGSSPNLIFKHQLFAGHIYGLVAILLFVGATGVFDNHR